MVIFKSNFLRPRRYCIASDLSIFNFDMSLFTTIHSKSKIKQYHEPEETLSLRECLPEAIPQIPFNPLL